MAIFSATDETDGISPIQLRAGADAPAAEHAVIIPKRITCLFDAAPEGYILDSSRVGGLGEQQLRHVPAQFSGPVRIGTDHHPFLYEQRAGGGYLGRPVPHVLDDAQTAGPDIGKIGCMAEMGDADAVMYRSIEHACAFRCADLRAVDSQGHIL
jgi:hypothetical protein